MGLSYSYVIPPIGQIDNNVVREMFDDVKAYLDAFVPSGGAAPIDASYVTLGTSALLTSERVLTAGTAISLTDGGAGSTVTIANTGVTSLVAGTGISLNAGTGAVTITNTNATSGATTALDNLAAVAINTSLLPGSSDAIDLGSASKYYQDAYIGREIVFHKSGDLATTLLIKPPAGLTSWTLTLPTSGGTNTYLLSTNGSGTTSWVAPTDTSGLATVALDNLSGVAINTTLKSDTDNTDDLGSAGINWRHVYTKDLVLRSGAVASNIITFKAPGTMSGDYTFTLPTTGGTNNYVLTTNGSGTTSWTDPGTFPTGANTALSNLASVAVNTTISSDTNNTDDLGTSSIQWKTIYGINLQSGLAGAPGSLQIYPVTASKGSILLSATDNAGNFNLSLTNASLAASRVYTFPDAGASANFVMSEGTATINGAKTFGSAVTITTSTANTLVVSTDQATTEVSIDNTATDGDPFLSWKLSGTKQFSMGVNDGASDVLQIGTTAIDTGTMWQATAAGEITQPLQPSFLMVNSAGATDVTGDGTAYTVLWPTGIYDQNSDFSSNTFTAPVTGRYLLSAHVFVRGLTSSHTPIVLSIVTSNREYRCTYVGGTSTLTGIPLSVTAIADMDAADTATTVVTVSGGTKVVDIDNDAKQNYFSGSLIN